MLLLKNCIRQLNPFCLIEVRLISHVPSSNVRLGGCSLKRSAIVFQSLKVRAVMKKSQFSVNVLIMKIDINMYSHNIANHLNVRGTDNVYISSSTDC